MADTSITLTAPIDGKQQTLTRGATIDDSLMPYFFACYRASYGQVDSGKVDDNKQPIMRDMTDEETFAKYAGGISNGTLANVQSFVRDQATKAALAQVPTIAITAN